mgnify:CR=1 FL=1
MTVRESKSGIFKVERLTRLALLTVFLIFVRVSYSEAGFISIDSEKSQQWAQVEITETGISQTSAELLLPTPVPWLLQNQTEFEALLQGSTTSSSSSSSSEIPPAALTRPVETQPLHSSRLRFLRGLLSNQVILTGIFRPPRWL